MTRIGTCLCGAAVFIKKTGECRTCYHRRYYHERRTPARRHALESAVCTQCGRTPVVQTTTMLCATCVAQKRKRARTDIVTYQAAHQRVRTDRGPASNWRCMKCGEPAEQWAYCAGSPREIRGTVERDGRLQNLRWSPDSQDYVPLCRVHHAELDGRAYRTGYRFEVGNTTQRQWNRESYARQVATPEGRQAYRERKQREREARAARQAGEHNDK